MAKVWRTSIMEILTKECMKMVTLMVLANTAGKMDLATKEILYEASDKEKESGAMIKEINTRVIFRKIKRTVQVYSPGQTAMYTKASSKMMSEKVKDK